MGVGRSTRPAAVLLQHPSPHPPQGLLHPLGKAVGLCTRLCCALGGTGSGASLYLTVFHSSLSRGSRSACVPSYRHGGCFRIHHLREGSLGYAGVLERLRSSFCRTPIASFEISGAAGVGGWRSERWPWGTWPPSRWSLAPHSRLQGASGCQEAHFSQPALTTAWPHSWGRCLLFPPVG